MVRKSATARMEQEFRESRKEATPAEIDAMYEAEAEYGVSFEDVSDYKRWKELQEMNRQIMTNSAQAPASSHRSASLAPLTMANFGSRQQQVSPRQASLNAHSTANVSTAPAPTSATSSTSFATHIAPSFGRGQPQSVNQALPGADSSTTRNASGPRESMLVTAQIPETKTKFLIGTKGRTIQHLQQTWSRIEISLRTQSVPHTLSIRGERTDLERFLLQVGSFLDENLVRFMPPRPTTAPPPTVPRSSQAIVHPRKESQLTAHRHYSVPPGLTGRLIGSNRRTEKQIEKDHSVRIGWFEDGAKCRISAATDAAICSALSAMNRIIRPAALTETPTTMASTPQASQLSAASTISIHDSHVSERGPGAITNSENMNLPLCNRSDFKGFRRGLSVANLGRLFPPPANVPPPTLTAEEEELQVTADDGLLSAAVEIENLELKMKSMLPVQHSVEALHANALWKAYLATFLYVADNIFGSVDLQQSPSACSASQQTGRYDVVDVVRKRHGVRDYTLSSKGFVTFRTVAEAERADNDDQKWSDAGIAVEKLRVKECAETGRLEPYWNMFDVAQLMRLRLIYAILNDEGFSGERWRSRPYRDQRDYYKREHVEDFGSRRQQHETPEAEELAQNGAKLRDGKHFFQIRRALCSYFTPKHFVNSPTDYEEYRWPREEVFALLDNIYAADNTALEDIETELRRFDGIHKDEMLFQWRNNAARFSEAITPPSRWQWLEIPGHYEVDEMIDTASGLKRWAAYLRSLPFDEAISLDIEGSTHGPNGLQLVQLSTFNKACIVDLAKCHNMPEFTELMEAIYYSKALKCDHDGKDFPNLTKYLTGTKVYSCVTIPLLLGHFNLSKKKDLRLDGSPRIGHIVAEYLGVRMRKGMGTSAWQHRPLTRGQTLYALLDSVAVALIAKRCYDENKEQFVALAKQDYQRAMQRQ